ncbi:MurR/RpiR family transcriptional regulator [Liquorilactobacillus capillatus]|nr:MurR/RpiR family transcriptional regulator [Liquorilactobacillus capillatus]
MNSEVNIIDFIYSKVNGMTKTDQKIAQVVLADPAGIINDTILKLAKKAQVSEASVSRFCRNLNLAGFHEFKMQLAKVATDENSYYRKIDSRNSSQALESIKDNKIAEITNTMMQVSPSTIDKVLDIIQKASIVQIAAEGDTYPVVADAIYKFNQSGFLTIGSESWETSVAQTLNLNKQAVLMVISNSGETRSLLKQIDIARQRGIKIIAITNRADSPIALKADLHLTTAVRQRVLQAEYYFSRVAAMTVIESLYLLLLAKDKERLNHIREHEEIISNKKI